MADVHNGRVDNPDSAVRACNVLTVEAMAYKSTLKMPVGLSVGNASLRPRAICPILKGDGEGNLRVCMALVK